MVTPNSVRFYFSGFACKTAAAFRHIVALVLQRVNWRTRCHAYTCCLMWLLPRFCPAPLTFINVYRVRCDAIYADSWQLIVPTYAALIHTAISIMDRFIDYSVIGHRTVHTAAPTCCNTMLPYPATRRYYQRLPLTA